MCHLSLAELKLKSTTAKNCFPGMRRVCICIWLTDMLFSLLQELFGGVYGSSPIDRLRPSCPQDKRSQRGFCNCHQRQQQIFSLLPLLELLQSVSE